FYKEAIDELLVYRPARRSTKQEFEQTEKRDILQRIALDRLEAVLPEEDPELLSRERLFEFAQQVLGAQTDKTKFQKLITELVEVNGIIKPLGDNGYVLGHRTFQEYFAAREATRTREGAAVVDRFGRRPELVETLVFYCGLLRNIPQIESVI